MMTSMTDVHYKGAVINELGWTDEDNKRIVSCAAKTFVSKLT